MIYFGILMYDMWVICFGVLKYDLHIMMSERLYVQIYCYRI